MSLHRLNIANSDDESSSLDGDPLMNASLFLADKAITIDLLRVESGVVITYEYVHNKDKPGIVQLMHIIRIVSR